MIKVKKLKKEEENYGEFISRDDKISKMPQEKNSGGIIGIEKRKWERISERTSRDEIYEKARRKRRKRRKRRRRREKKASIKKKYISP